MRVLPRTLLASLVAVIILGTGGPSPLVDGVTAATNAAACVTFPETGKVVCDRFLAYWQANGGLAINGYPLTEARIERLEDGKQYEVQWFERVRMEYHPENQPPHDVLLGQFGRRIHPADPPIGALPGLTYFSETGHNVPDDFIEFWNVNGGLAQFGYPLTEMTWETLEDGRHYNVQYFERARFERHPENSPPNHILLGQFGRRLLASTAPSPPPSSSPRPSPSPSPPPATPRLSISPTSGPAGTKFVASGYDLPAGARIDWSLTCSGCQANTGTFTLNPGSTSFDFTITTDGSPARSYTISFAANGRSVGTLGFTITAPSTPSPRPNPVPSGWQYWRGLPLPGYFQLWSEGPSSSSPGCYIGTFANLPSGGIPAVREQVRQVWGQVGIISQPAQGLYGSSIDEYSGPTRSGIVGWPTGSDPLWRVTILDCPR